MFRAKRSVLAGMLVLALLAGWLFVPADPPSSHASPDGTTWYVTTPTDDANDGNPGTHSGSLRFTLAHAASGDFVSFAHYDSIADTIFVASPLVVPAGVAVGHLRNQACGSYAKPLINLEATDATIDPVISLGASATLRGLDIGGGRITVRITGANVDVCGVGLGLEYDNGSPTTLPPASLALSIDGDHTVIHRNYINGAVVVSTNGSDTRIGDAIGGGGDTDDGVRDASVTVLADATRAAQRVTIRDPFPRALNGLVGTGASGGDDVVNHANNWAQTPTILDASTYDHFATVQVHGIANPLSEVDIFFDNQLTVARQPPVTADANGYFTFSGALPGNTVWVIAVSTLNDPAHSNRVGSSSQFSAQVKVTPGVATTSLQLAPAGLSFSAVVSGPLPLAQPLWVTPPSISPTLAWQTSVTTTEGLSWLAAVPGSSSGSGALSVTVMQVGLPPGVYHGSVKVSDVAQPGDWASSAITLEVKPASTLSTKIWLPLILH